MALPAFHVARIFEATGRLRRSRIAPAFQTFDFLWTNGDGEVARTNLRRAALQLVHQSPGDLSRHLWRRIFSIDVCDAAIGGGGIPQQYRMVCSDLVLIRARSFSARVADCSVFNAGRDVNGRTFLHGARAHRAKV